LGQPLKKLGLNNDISASDDYASSMAWAKATCRLPAPLWLLGVREQQGRAKANEALVTIPSRRAQNPVDALRCDGEALNRDPRMPVRNARLREKVRLTVQGRLKG
jgi:hypothetical protein